jgi:hypothetical protein
LFGVYRGGLSGQLDELGLAALWSTSAIYALSALVLLAMKPLALRVVVSKPGLWALMLASGATNACFNWV